MPDKNLLRIPGTILILAGLTLAAGGIATWLSPANRHHAEELTRGLWLFKGMLIAHGLFFFFWHRIPDLTSGATLISPRVLARGSTEPGWTRWAVIAVVLLGLGLRLPGLNQGLWFDEIQTLVEYVRIPMSQILTTFDSQNQHVLYSLSARAVASLTGESAWALRLPAVLFGTASLWATWWLGRQVAGWREGLLAAALLIFVVRFRLFLPPPIRRRSA